MAEVLFLSPPRRADGSRALFNNASLTLASYLVRNGVDARVEPLVGPDWGHDLLGYLDRHQPRVAAISCKWWDTLYGATQVAHLVRDLRPGTQTLVGGQTASYFARDLVGRGHVDAVARGDGEKPLLDYVRGKPDGNLTFRNGNDLIVQPITYVQPRGGTEDLSLLDDMRAVADERFLRFVGHNAPFVWTGKGCQSTCLYCGGSALGHKTLFGRTGYAYRPIEQVIHDMEILGPWSGDTFLFDFDPVTDPTKREYYRELLRELPRGRYHAAFFCWSLPDDEFIELVARTFRSCNLGIDAQTYSEPLRRRLAKTAWIKPFSSDRELVGALETCRRLPNVAAVMYGIVGLATETAADVERAERFLGELLDAYGDIFGELELTPLSIEPGALVAHNPDKYGMVALRQSFDDYMAVTKVQFDRDRRLWDAPFEGGLPHPYGLHQKLDAPDRVWHDYRRLHGMLDRRMQEIVDRAAYESLSIEPDRVTLRLQNRSVFQDVWRLVPWATFEAINRAIPLVEVDATRAWINVPALDTLDLEERYDWVAGRVRELGKAVQAGKLRVVVRAAPGQRWGAIKDAGAEVFSTTAPV